MNSWVGLGSDVLLIWFYVLTGTWWILRNEIFEQHSGNHLQHLNLVAANFPGQVQLTLSSSWIVICEANIVHTLCIVYLQPTRIHHYTKKQEMIRLLDLSYRGSLSQSVSQWHSSRVQKGYTVCPWVKSQRWQKNHSAKHFPLLYSLKSKEANSLNGILWTGFGHNS